MWYRSPGPSELCDLTPERSTVMSDALDNCMNLGDVNTDTWSVFILSGCMV